MEEKEFNWSNKTQRIIINIFIGLYSLRGKVNSTQKSSFGVEDIKVK